MELDRTDSSVDDAAWAPFAKAFHGLPFKFLETVPLEAALALRRDGRLGHLRHFLRKIWSANAQANAFADANIAVLASELDEKVREAEAEWRQIDRDLVKLFAGEAAAAALAAGPLISSGHAAWLAAGVALAGLGNVVNSSMRRVEYRLKYPAGFFLELQNEKHL